jgi:hypothetical protein
LNPKFVTSFQIDYFFEKEQRIKFTVIDIDNNNEYEHLGTCITTLAKIINASEGFKQELFSLEGKKTNQKIIISSNYIDTNVNDYVL